MDNPAAHSDIGVELSGIPGPSPAAHLETCRTFSSSSSSSSSDAGPHACAATATLTNDAKPARCQYYNDRHNYRILDEYSVAEGCDAEEIMGQIACAAQGDNLFRHVSKLGGAMEPISCALLSSPVLLFPHPFVSLFSPFN
jgi:hypothetical protein